MQYCTMRQMQNKIIDFLTKIHIYEHSSYQKRSRIAIHGDWGGMFKKKKLTLRGFVHIFWINFGFDILEIIMESIVILKIKKNIDSFTKRKHTITRRFCLIVKSVTSHCKLNMPSAGPISSHKLIMFVQILHLHNIYI